MGFLYPELSAPPCTNPTLHVLPSQSVQHHGASETVPVSRVESAVMINVGKSESDFHTNPPTEKGNHWPAWYFQLLSPTFLCVLLWNSIGTITFSAKTFGLILLETVLGQCGRFRRSWCSRKRGAHAKTIPTSAGCNGLCSFRLRFTIFFMFMALGALHSLTLQELKRSDEMRYLENQQVIFRLLFFGIMLSLSTELISHKIHLTENH